MLKKILILILLSSITILDIAHSKVVKNNFPKSYLTIIGVLDKGTGDINHKGKKVNEFTINERCLFQIYSKELRDQFHDFLGQQVMISGWEDFMVGTQIIQENPSIFFSIGPTVMKVEKIQPITCLTKIIPEKIDWNKPIEIKFQFKNPLDMPIENIELRMRAQLRHRVRCPKGPQQKIKLALAANDKKIISVFLDPISDADKKMEKIYVGMPNEDLGKIGFRHQYSYEQSSGRGRYSLMDENTGELIIFDTLDGKVESWKRDRTDCIETYIYLTIESYKEGLIIVFEDVIAIYDSQGNLKNK